MASEKSSTNPQSFYGIGKLASERYLKIYEKQGILSTSLRLFNVYGPGQNLNNMKQGMISIYLSQIMKKIISCKRKKNSISRFYIYR